MSFDNLGLSQPLLDAIAREKYTQPTPVQAQAIPQVLAGHDVLAAAQTGTGKTAAFTLPLLQRLSDSVQKNPRVLILTPTRELATQVADNARSHGKELKLHITTVYGGVSEKPQIKAFRNGVDMVVATPGRLLDHLQQGNIDLSALQTLVLDEADRMLDMGFIHDIKRIFKYLPNKRQNLLFSATFSKDIRKLAAGLLNKPVEIDVAPRNTTATGIEQHVVLVEKSRKRAVLSYLIGSNNWRQVLVFSRTKHGANRLATQLESDGLAAAALHGNKSQSARTKALASFKAGKIRVLVATDIAARGIDIETLPHVINFDLPHVAEDYVHRIGRTGRAGHTGQALSLVGPDERKLLKAIERLIGDNIERMDVSGVDLRGSDNEPQEQQQRPRSDNRPQKRRPRNTGGNGDTEGKRKQRPARRGRGPQQKTTGDGQQRADGQHNRRRQKRSPGKSRASAPR